MAEIIRFQDIRQLLTDKKARELAVRIIDHSLQMHRATDQLQNFALSIIEPPPKN